MATAALQQIQDLSSSPLDQIMSTLKSADAVLRQAANGADGPALLLALSRAFVTPHQTIAIVHILNLAAQGSHSQELFNACSAVMSNGDAVQFQQNPKELSSLAGHLRDMALAARQPRRVISPLQTALAKLRGDRPLITPLHAMLFQCCLLANIPSAALPALDQEAYDVDPSATSMVVRDFLLYCYYGGLIHIAQKQYAKAAELLLGALTAPSVVTHAIVVAAWKKWALIGLLTQGSIPALPKWAPQTVVRAARLEGMAYQDLAAAYNGRSAQALTQVVQNHHRVFSEDENLGLVKLVVEAQTKRNILRLTQTFITLSLTDIAKQVELPSAEAAELAILRMVDAGEVYAEIDGGRGMVRFLEAPQQFESAATVATLDACINSTAALGKRLACVCAEVSCSMPYLMKIHNKGSHPVGTVAGNLCEDDEAFAAAMMPPEPIQPGSSMQS